ncbi:c-type cytochrome biogenesis protein CcsB [Niallia nealsonii]|uniref:C-type cytochrome biogenesis protein CcsB n=1 Tax=Niallia nealsonii TaxID=115979 RepID=A0A2N0Z3S7_9BACI|nr:c-type cytochrome biogenesis protein CcsB [Niallia nealsonii]PKG24165.1 c-type cytochrome biogenesis protein CcsB [Niallia nealsonii]
MASVSSNFLFASFLLYIVATLFFGGGVNQRQKDKKKMLGKFSTIGMIITVFAFFSHLTYFILRWIASGHAPVSNLFEFICFFALAIVAGFLLIVKLYQLPSLGVFTLPVVIVLLAYANMFPKDVAPLIPALQSSWLKIHVITAALGEGILSVSFAAGFIYLLKSTNDQNIKSIKGIELIIFIFLSFIGFILLNLILSSIGFKEEIYIVDSQGEKTVIEYHMPPIIGPAEKEAANNTDFQPFLTVPATINSGKLNSLLLSVVAGGILYVLARLILRKRVGTALKPLVKNVSLDLLDEISYRSVLIGFPVFTLGALIFAMIWAQIAWSRFWDWDPKEVWALITWLFYAAFLHLRIAKDWQGKKSAWLAVLGFIIIMFNLIVVNLIMVGLHSYA